MLHVWFTNDLRSASAIGAPEPELCRLDLLSGAFCRTRLALRDVTYVSTTTSSVTIARSPPAPDSATVHDPGRGA